MGKEGERAPRCTAVATSTLASTTAPSSESSNLQELTSGLNILSLLCVFASLRRDQLDFIRKGHRLLFFRTFASSSIKNSSRLTFDYPATDQTLHTAGLPIPTPRSNHPTQLRNMSTTASPNPRVGVAAIIANAQGQIVSGKRQGSHGAGTWQLPGGHLEYGESFFACAEREVLEETGLRVRGVKVAAVTNDIFADQGKHYITIFVKCEMEDATAQPEVCSSSLHLPSLSVSPSPPAFSKAGGWEGPPVLCRLTADTPC